MHLVQITVNNQKRVKMLQTLITTLYRNLNENLILLQFTINYTVLLHSQNSQSNQIKSNIRLISNDKAHY